MKKQKTTEPAGDPTRFLNRSFTWVENKNQNVRLIDRNEHLDPQRGVSIAWEDLPALRELITLALEDGPMVIGKDVSAAGDNNLRDNAVQGQAENSGWFTEWPPNGWYWMRGFYHYRTLPVEVAGDILSMMYGVGTYSAADLKGVEFCALPFPSSLEDRVAEKVIAVEIGKHTPNALALDAEPSAGRHHGIFGFDQPEPSTPPNLERLAAEIASKVVYSHEFQNVPNVAAIILSTLQGTDLFIAGVEAACALAENPYGDEVRAMGGDEPKAVGLKIATAARALVPNGREEAEAGRVKELEDALGGMVAAFDGDGYGDKSIVETTRECALSVAIQTLGWERPSTTPKDSGVEEKNQG